MLWEMTRIPRNAPYQDNRSNSSSDYLRRAAIAVNAGDKILGVHLYLAAFERALAENIVPSNEVLEGMGKACGSCRFY